MKEKLTRFEDMPVWQESQQLAVAVYIATYSFPSHEQYGLTSQLRRAGSSVSANIAEGFGRATNKDRIHFYHISLGSLLETKNFVYLAGRLEYLQQDTVDKIISDIESIHSQITAIIRYLHEKA